MEVSEEIIYNFLVDLKKKDINPIERAKIIDTYMKEKKLGLRELSRELNIPHTTIKGWIDYKKIEEEYDELISKGVSKTQIHNKLRYYKQKTELNKQLHQIISTLRVHILNPEYNKDTVILMAELRNIINRIEIHIEQKMKKGEIK